MLDHIVFVKNVDCTATHFIGKNATHTFFSSNPPHCIEINSGCSIIDEGENIVPDDVVAIINLRDPLMLYLCDAPEEGSKCTKLGYYNGIHASNSLPFPWTTAHNMLEKKSDSSIEYRSDVTRCVIEPDNKKWYELNVLFNTYAGTYAGIASITTATTTTTAVTTDMATITAASIEKSIPEETRSIMSKDTYDEDSTMPSIQASNEDSTTSRSDTGGNYLGLIVGLSVAAGVVAIGTALIALEMKAPHVLSACVLNLTKFINGINCGHWCRPASGDDSDRDNEYAMQHEHLMNNDDSVV